MSSVTIKFTNGNVFADVKLRWNHKVIEDRQMIQDILTQSNEYKDLKLCECVYNDGTVGDIFLEFVECFSFENWIMK